MGFFSSLVSFFSTAAKSITGGALSTAARAAADLGSAVTFVYAAQGQGQSPAGYSPASTSSAEEDFYRARAAALYHLHLLNHRNQMHHQNQKDHLVNHLVGHKDFQKFPYQAPDLRLADEMHIYERLQGLISIYGGNQDIPSELKPYVHNLCASGNNLARRFADYYIHVFLNSPEGKLFVKTHGKPDIRYFGVGDLGYTGAALNFPLLNMVVANIKMFHATFVDPAGYAEAIRVLNHESIHQLGDHEEYSTYTKSSDFLAHAGAQAAKRGDHHKASELKSFSKLEKKVRDKFYRPGSNVPLAVRGLEVLKQEPQQRLTV